MKFNLINVTKTFLPPQEAYQEILKESWDSGWITNRGALVKRLESQLKEYLDVPNIMAMTNGTIPIQIAIKALQLKGQIITTPFSYVATTSSIVWENCDPVFVDISPDYLTIDEAKIEKAITSETTAILATHVFGNPCAVEAIETIALRHNLKVIYDAAHCFGVNYKGKSLFRYGDISTCSFHATKLFHTGEGGALFTENEDLLNKLFYHHNFGHRGKEDFQGLGINGKMSELQAALGLSVLPYMDQILSARKVIVEKYLNLLEDSSVEFLKLREHTDWNYSYFPVLFKSNEILSEVIQKLNGLKIFPRRYFYPSLDTLPYIKDQECPVSRNISSRVLCLPLFHDLEVKNIELICNVIKKII